MHEVIKEPSKILVPHIRVDIQSENTDEKQES